MASAYGIALSDGGEKSIGTRMRLKRIERDARLRTRGFWLTPVAIGPSTKVFIPKCCDAPQRGAPHKLLKAYHFLAADV
jgi:hypothetical protein